LEKQANLDLLFEWAVWGHLESKKELELIVLKGHLLLEMALGNVISRNNIKDFENYSFYRKISILNSMEITDSKNDEKRKFIVESLLELNKYRNKLAHEFLHKIEDDDIIAWSERVLKNLKGTKYSKYTFKTRIIHSFSVLSINLLSLSH